MNNLTTEQVAKWINVDERLPDDGETVFVAMRKNNGYTYTQIADYDSGKWRDDMNRDVERGPDYWAVTHWMPLPDPPIDATTHNKQ